MKNTFTERNAVVALFVLVIVTFSFAQRDSKRLERLYTLKPDKKTNVAAVKKAAPAGLPVK